MMPLTLSRRENLQGVVLGVLLGIFLAGGFLPTADSFFEKLVPAAAAWDPFWRACAQRLAFPVLAAFFFLSLTSRSATERGKWRPLLETFPIALVISLLFGLTQHGPPLVVAWKTQDGRLAILWYVVSVAIGEELLFRGWCYNVIDRIFPDRLATWTNGLPLAVWSTALGFALWHGQNLARDPWPLVAFQITYTFFTGLWLGYLRWRGGGLWLPVLAHVGLNAICNVF